MKKTRQETEKLKTAANEKESIMEDGINNDVEICISTQEMIQDARERREKRMTVFKCEQYDYSSSSKTLLKRHINTIHVQSKNMLKDKENKSGTSSKRIHCTYCDKKFNKKETFEKHMKTFHGEENAGKKKQLEGHNILSN